MAEDVYEKKLDETIPETVKNTAEKYDEEVAQFTESLKEVDDVEKLHKLEEDIIKDIDANNERLAAVKYPLPEQTTFRGQVFTRAKASGFVADLLNAQEVGWQMTLGLFDVIDFWKKIASEKGDTTEVPYQIYDATLRFLGQQKYRGYEMFKKVLVVSGLFADARDLYLNDLTYTYYLANKHNAIIEREGAIEALNTPGVKG